MQLKISKGAILCMRPDGKLQNMQCYMVPGIKGEESM